MTTTPTTSSDRMANFWFGVIGLAIAVSVIVYAAAWCSAALSSTRKPTWSLLAVVDVARDAGHPGEAFDAVFPAALFWAVLALMLAAVLAAGLSILRAVVHSKRRALKDPHRFEGLATRREVQRLYGAKAVTARASVLRPSLEHVSPADVAYCLGNSRGVAVYNVVENSLVLVAPARQGKTKNIVSPAILEAPGAVVATSVRSELAEETWRQRAAGGRQVAVYDPTSAATGIEELGALRWSLTRGCADPEVAMRRATAMTAQVGKGVENASFWSDKARQVVMPLLHAAELDGGGVDALFDWASSPHAAQQAVAILRDHPHAAPGWASALEAVTDMADEKTRANVWSQVEQAIVMTLLLPSVREAVSPRSAAESLDLEQFIRGRGTLYIIAGATGTAAPIVAALVEDVYATAYKMANRSPGGRLDPPLLLALDEVANIAKLPSLPEMVSAGGGAGITTLVVLQSLAQARDRWGVDAAGAIWGSATSKVIMGGIVDERDLSAISAMLGEHAEIRTSTSTSASGDSRSWSQHDRKVMTPGQVRELPIGTALLLSGSNPAVLLDLIPVWKRKSAKIPAAVPTK